MVTVALACVAPLFYTALPKLITAYFTRTADTLSTVPKISQEHLILQTKFSDNVSSQCFQSNSPTHKVETVLSRTQTGQVEGELWLSNWTHNFPNRNNSLYDKDDPMLKQNFSYLHVNAVVISCINKLAKLRRHASRVHFAKLHFG